MKPALILASAAGVFFILNSSVALAADEFDPVASGFRMLWGLLIVLAVIYILYAVLRKRVSTFNQSDKNIIKIIDIKHIMPKKTLMLIEVRGKEYLVGGGNDSINTILPINQTNTFSEFLDHSEEKKPL